MLSCSRKGEHHWRQKESLSDFVTEEKCYMKILSDKLLDMGNRNIYQVYWKLCIFWILHIVYVCVCILYKILLYYHFSVFDQYLLLAYNFLIGIITLVQFSHSVVSDSLWPVDCSMPGFPVHHQLLELAQIHVHQVSDVPFSSCLQSFPASGSFQWVSSSRQVATVLEFQHQSFQWIVRTDFF